MRLRMVITASVESPKTPLMWTSSQMPIEVSSQTSLMTSVVSAVIRARLMNKGPTVPRTNRLNISNGIITGTPVNAQNSADLIGKTRLWFDLIHLALQTDSSRLITLQLLGTSSVPPIPGVSQGHHDLSHHGQEPAKIAQLRVLEIEKMKTLLTFFNQLKDTKEEGQNLLDRTTVFFSSNLADASKHSVKNMPVLLAGGGFKHGQHLAFDENKNPPLCNLFVSMLQRMGIEADKFGSSTGTLTGLDMRG